MTDANTNVRSWESMYAQGRSLLRFPDDAVTSALTRHQGFSTGLDLGCGAGRHALLMAQMGITSQGIDTSPSSIAHARSRAKELEMNNVQFQEGRVQDISLEPESQSIIICWGVVHYLELEDQTEVLAKIHRLLKPGGLLLATLRSTQDTLCDANKQTSHNRYECDYFDAGTADVKRTSLSFWNQDGVQTLLSEFAEVKLGHRTVQAVGRLERTSAHWLVEARKTNA